MQLVPKAMTDGSASSSYARPPFHGRSRQGGGGGYAPVTVYRHHSPEWYRERERLRRHEWREHERREHQWQEHHWREF
jgi:hypothetical protein